MGFKFKFGERVKIIAESPSFVGLEGIITKQYETDILGNTRYDVKLENYDSMIFNERCLNAIKEKVIFT